MCDPIRLLGDGITRPTLVPTGCLRSQHRALVPLILRPLHSRRILGVFVYDASTTQADNERTAS